MPVRIYSNGKNGSVPRLNILVVSGGMMGEWGIGRACESCTDTNISINLMAADSELLDGNEESFMTAIEHLRHSDFVIVNIHSDLSYFKKYERLRKEIDRLGIVTFVQCGAPEVMESERVLFHLPDEEYDLVKSYIQLGGSENNFALMLWTCSRIGGIQEIICPEPFKPLVQGIYHDGVQPDIDPDAYYSGLKPNGPTIGILLHQNLILRNDTAAIDALIDCLESKGANTVPVFFVSSPSELSGSIGLRAVVERYFMCDGRPRVGSVIMTSAFSQLTLSDSFSDDHEVFNFFQELGVAVLQAPGILRSPEAWGEDIIGMSPVEISTNVVMPEYDGQIITVPLSFTVRNDDGTLVHTTVADRVDRISSLAISWAILRDTPNNDRKVAIMLNMYPPSNDRLGGAGGLDTFQSLMYLLNSMHTEGYLIERIPDSGKEILDEILAGLTNDFEWVPNEEIESRAADMISESGYGDWFKELPPCVFDAMCRNWGDPPGDIATHGGKFIVPGVINGNVFIGIQPNRGYHDNVEEFYHSTDVVIPHQYLAYYRWIRDVFEADVIIHMGTHGTLEWLPGKGNGLSSICYPDVVLDTMPNVYPYIIDDPSEGVEAKRRTNSVLSDYMVPTMTRAGSYDQMMDLDAALQGYLNSRETGQEKKIEIDGEAICGLISSMSMYKELGLPDDASENEILSRVELIYDYVTEMKDALIKDGLHVLGQIPQEERLMEMVYSLTRLRNGNIPSLRTAVCSAMGHDLDELLKNPSGVEPATGMLNGSILDSVDKKVWDIVKTIHDSGYYFDNAKLAVTELFNESDEVESVIEFICNTLHPNICKMTDEIGSILGGISGGYVLPGPSGAPTRGNAHLLPTGRNFFSIDPDAIPGSSSWKIGMAMAQDMIDRYVKDNGAYPENVAIIVWAIDTMKTGGDDIAYLLYLMGLRPKWSSYGGKVVGLEVIPLEELGRPRIDVTLRISGMFRDSFPNLVDIIDEGVEMVSELDEDDQSNFIKKHLRLDMEKYIVEGMSPEEARISAMIRIFGDPPGQHGCGTGVLIESSKWDTLEDIAQVYTQWGCYAYGRRWRGDKKESVFKSKMSQMNVTVKNHNDREFDLLDIDDDYEVLGGLNSVIRAYGGFKPYSVMGDSSDTDHLKIRTLEEETAYVMRSRVLNPKWFNGLKEHGFNGAMELAKLTEYMLGWDATSDSIEPWMYEAVTDRFIFDESSRSWIHENNPYALREMIEDMLEAIDRDLWDASDETLQRLTDLYLEMEGELEADGNKASARNS